MNEWWFVAGMVGGFACLVFLVISVRALVRMQRGSILVEAPLLPDQIIAFNCSGSLLLNIEVPNFELSVAPVHFQYRLANAQTGHHYPLELGLLPIRTSGVSRARRSVGRFDLPEPGDVRVSVSNLAADLDLGKYRLLFTRDARRSLVGHILKIVLSALGLMGALALCTVVFVLNAQ